MLLKKWLMLPCIFVVSLLTFYIISLQTYSINSDGILYLQTAYAMGQSSINAAFHVYAWPFYSIMVYWLSIWTHISLVHSATMINAVLQALTAIFFWLILDELDKRLVLSLIAALTILLYPQFNGYRDYIMRDFGYWAFFLCGLWGMLRYARKNSLLNIFIFYVGFVSAFFFRIEGFCFLVLLPLICLFFTEYHFSKRVWLATKLYLPGVILAILASGYFLIVKHENLMFIGRMPQLGVAMLHGWTEVSGGFRHFSALLVSSVLTPDAKNSAPYITLWGLSGLWLQKIIAAPGIIFTALFAYGHYYKTLKTTNSQKAILYFIILIYVGLSFYFIFTKYFLVDRYLLAMSFVVLLWTPSALYDLYQRCKKRWMFALMIFILLIVCSGGIIKYGPSKVHLVQSAAWLNQHRSDNSVICTNDKFLLYKADGITMSFDDLFDTPYDMLKQTNVKCNYIAAVVNRKRVKAFLKLQNKYGITPMQIFKNRHGDTVFIYKINL